MKRSRIFSTAIGLCLLALTTTTQAQQTGGSLDVPRTISYQGLLSSPDGKPIADGRHEITVTLYGDVLGTEVVWRDTYEVTTRQGIFNLYIGDHTPLPESAEMNRPLWVGTTVGNSQEMRPLTPLTASPYALNLPDRAVTTDKLADGAVTAGKVDMDYVAGFRINGEEISGKGTVLDIRSSDDIDLQYDEGSQSLHIVSAKASRTDGNPDRKGAQTLATPNGWNSQGDLTDGSAQVRTSTGDWIGTTADVNNNEYDFIIKVHDQQIMKYQHRTDANTPNIVGGYSGNSITAASIGGVIAGGGNSNALNRITNDADYAVISGGKENTASNFAATIAGGSDNTASGSYATVNGGASNTASGLESIAGGGRNNQASGSWSSVLGGNLNTASSSYSTVAGGRSNLNQVSYGAIGGGYINSLLSGPYSTISGGAENSIGGTAGYNTIAGGGSNVIGNAGNATISGGLENSIAASANTATIGGGYRNSITSGGVLATIPGGNKLTAQSYVQTVLGVSNIPKGSIPPGFIVTPTPTYNPPIFMIGNGNDLQASNAFEVSYNGHSIVFDENNSGGAVGGGGRGAVEGGTYTDNVIYGWAEVGAGGTVTASCADFGIKSITMPIPGTYRIELNPVGPDGSTPVYISCGSAVATLGSGADPGEFSPALFPCQTYILTSNVKNNVFEVYIGRYNAATRDCVPAMAPFKFHVTGRPVDTPTP